MGGALSAETEETEDVVFQHAKVVPPHFVGISHSNSMDVGARNDDGMEENREGLIPEDEMRDDPIKPPHAYYKITEIKKVESSSIFSNGSEPYSMVISEEKKKEDHVLIVNGERTQNPSSPLRNARGEQEEAGRKSSRKSKDDKNHAEELANDSRGTKRRRKTDKGKESKREKMDPKDSSKMIEGKQEPFVSTVVIEEVMTAAPEKIDAIPSEVIAQSAKEEVLRLFGAGSTSPPSRPRAESSSEKENLHHMLDNLRISDSRLLDKIPILRNSSNHVVRTSTNFTPIKISASMDSVTLSPSRPTSNEPRVQPFKAVLTNWKSPIRNVNDRM
eukprot:TRINITY_DN2017_c0_g1_i1.p1 TRINITY_DN2017_c0_g1~~TRINITY_DN2017_c0_g1_i1.p1  ORF type:complete len:331 (+),score=85.16 TRINITY_DN2017_c0_g1_i1:185-1177(+)